MKEDEVLAVIEDKTEKKPAVIKGQIEEKTKKTSKRDTVIRQRRSRTSGTLHRVCRQ